MDAANGNAEEMEGRDQGGKGVGRKGGKGCGQKRGGPGLR